MSAARLGLRALFLTFALVPALAVLPACVGDISETSGGEVTPSGGARCGDGTCGGSESCTSCASDCGRCTDPGATCGDGTCDATEDCSSCVGDCGVCAATCGDGQCAGGETCTTCPSECGACMPDAPVCGDGACTGGETCTSCESDCGVCLPMATCGNGTCEDSELCGTCEADCGACPDSTPAVTRFAYLNTGTSTGLVVKWRTSSSTDSVVAFGESPAALTAITRVDERTTDHEVRLTGLRPMTRYYYAYGATTAPLVGGDDQHTFTTAVPAGMARQTRIWVIGDAGTANDNQRAVRDAYAAFTGTRATDLWIMLGDNAYSDGTDAEYQRGVFDIYTNLLRSSVVWSTLGNHDGHTADSATQSGPYYDIFTFPTAGEAGGVPSGTEAYYSFDYGNIHFVCLDSYDSDRSRGGAMLTWLENDLSATTSQWLIAFWHHPPYSKGSHDSDSESGLRDMRQNALPILESYGVDLVLGGHSHSYERSYFLHGHYGSSTTLTDAMILDRGNGREGGGGAYAKPATSTEGAVYIVAGSSGKVSSADLDHPAMTVNLLELGSVVIDVDGARMDVVFLDETGAERDSFTIRKD